jgi:hypothetical protein
VLCGAQHPTLLVCCGRHDGHDGQHRGGWASDITWRGTVPAMSNDPGSIADPPDEPVKDPGTIADPPDDGDDD